MSEHNKTQEENWEGLKRKRLEGRKKGEGKESWKQQQKTEIFQKNILNLFDEILFGKHVK